MASLPINSFFISLTLLFIQKKTCPIPRTSLFAYLCHLESFDFRVPSYPPYDNVYDTLQDTWKLSPPFPAPSATHLSSPSAVRLSAPRILCKPATGFTLASTFFLSIYHSMNHFDCQAIYFISSSIPEDLIYSYHINLIFQVIISPFC